METTLALHCLAIMLKGPHSKVSTALVASLVVMMHCLLRLQVEASKTSPKIERLEGVAAPLPRPSLPPLLPPPRDVHRLSGESLARSEQLLGK